MTGLAAVVEQLRDIVGPAHVLVDADLRRGYEVDWTGRFRGEAAAVVRPASTAEVSDVLRRCHDSGVPVVTQGGNTGLVGGGVPLHGEVVLSTQRMTALEPVDPAMGQVTVAAGATLAAVQEHVGRSGFEMGIDFGARDSATVGGMVATNAGGARAFRYGSMRQQIVGIEAVLAGGRVVGHLSGLLKDNTGYDYASLFAGSEGTLAVVTRVRVRLYPARSNRATALLGLETVDDLVEVFARLRARVPELEAADFMTADGVALVCEYLGSPSPLQCAPSAYLIVETASVTADPLDHLTDTVDGLGSVVVDAAVAVEKTRRDELWRYREAHSEAINALGVPHKLDVAVPLQALPRFLRDITTVVTRRAPGAQSFCFGHVGDGNVHVNAVGVADDEAIDDAVLGYAVSLGGTISAEHGIGSAKARWLHLVRSPAELELFGAIKGALDPNGILNPHVLLPSRILYT